MMYDSNEEKTVITTKTSKLSLLFHKGSYQVPWHQRYYDWERHDVSDLLEDLDEAVLEDRKCYFLGAIMLVEREDGLWEINDGQQRMVTFSLICARLVRIFAEVGDNLRENQALRILFSLGIHANPGLAQTDRLEPRLTPPQNDKMRYGMLIRGRNISRNGKLTAAWDIVNEYFRSKTLEYGQTFFDYLMNKLEVACIYVPRGLDPNSFFETLNARGKPLEEVDKIRNHIYSFFGEGEKTRRNTIHENLESMRVKLREERSKSKSEEYIRCYLQCRFGALSKGRLHREVKLIIRDSYDDSLEFSMADFVFDLVEDMAKGERIEIFHSISSPRESDVLITEFLRDAPGNPQRNMLVFLTELKRYTVTRPIVFALIDRYVQAPNRIQRKKIAKFVHTRLKLVTSFVMRTAFVIRQFQPSHLERQFATLAQQVMSSDSLDDIDFYKSLSEVDNFGILDDSNFKALMERAPIRSGHTGKAKRLLLGLAYKRQPGLTLNETAYTVEHVLPESSDYLPHWKNFDERDHQANVHRIGNLTLLSNSDNRPGVQNNRSFTRKKEIFDRSTICLTKEISQVDDWSPQAIEERQKKMAELAADVWEIPHVLLKK